MSSPVLTAMLLAPPAESMQTPSRSSTSVALALAKALSPPACRGICRASLPASLPPLVYVPYSLFSTQQPKWYKFFKAKSHQVMCFSDAFPSYSIKARVLPMVFVDTHDLHWGRHLSDLHSSLGSLEHAPSQSAPLQGLALLRLGACLCPESCRICFSSPPAGSLLTMSLSQWSLSWSSFLLYHFPPNTPYPGGQPQGFFCFFLRTFHILTDCRLSPFIFCLPLERNATRVDTLMSPWCLQHLHLCLSHHRPFTTSTCWMNEEGIVLWTASLGLFRLLLFLCGHHMRHLSALMNVCVCVCVCNTVFHGHRWCVSYTISGASRRGCFPSLGDGLEPARSHTRAHQSPFCSSESTSVGHLVDAGGTVS